LRNEISGRLGIWQGNIIQKVKTRILISQKVSLIQSERWASDG
jgi:hypothetical protein